MWCLLDKKDFYYTALLMNFQVKKKVINNDKKMNCNWLKINNSN